MIDLQCGVVDVVAIRKQGLPRSPALMTVMTAPGQDVRGQCRKPRRDLPNVQLQVARQVRCATSAAPPRRKTNAKPGVPVHLIQSDG